MNISKKRNAEKAPNYCMIVTGTLVFILAILIARSPIIKIRKPLKANYVKLHDYIPYAGILETNDLLEKAKYIAHKKIKGPECIAISNDGSIYTGLVNGKIVRVNVASDSLTEIVQIGHETNKEICNDSHHHHTCGYPLGLRFHPDHHDILYVADAFNGIYKIDVKLGSKKLVLNSNDSRFGDLSMKLTDDLDIDGDTIYFVDASYEHSITELFDELIEASPAGRLFSYDEKNDKLELIASRLYFPNGVQLMPDKREILVNEFHMARIIKIQLTGDKKGSKEIFAELPGFGDTIRLTEHNTLLVPFGISRNEKMKSINDYLGEYPLMRSLLFSVLHLESIVEHYRDHLVKSGLLVEYDLNGKMLKSWHDPTGKVIDSLTSAVLYKNKIFLGTLDSEYMAVIDY